MGGDECPPDEWRATPAVREFMRARGLADERALHGWYIAQMADAPARARPAGVRLGRDPGRRRPAGRHRGGLARPGPGGPGGPRRPRRGVPARTPRSTWTTGSRPTRASRRPTGTLLTVDDVYALRTGPARPDPGRGGPDHRRAGQRVDRAHGVGPAGGLHGVPAAVRVRRGGLGPVAPASPSGWPRTWPGSTRWASTTGRRPGRGRGTRDPTRRVVRASGPTGRPSWRR